MTYCLSILSKDRIADLAETRITSGNEITDEEAYTKAFEDGDTQMSISLKNEA